ncbi:aspartate kinase [Tissierella carlieri]|uniref:Aspartokinase n=1 Tax=Tissierella carlieri TaxID=689904 RepID=A0ABT1S7K8_9FIRM|nr:aspartate kinase [Tissierella carlieri]
MIVAKFGGSSLADSTQFVKVKDVVNSDTRRRYIIPSAPGKRNSKDHKITDLLYMCYQLASHGLNFDEVYAIIEERYKDICNELNLSLQIDKTLNEIKDKIKNGASRDYSASRGEYLNAIILSNYLGFEFIDAAELIVFDKKGNFDSETTEKKVQLRLSEVSYGVIPGFYGAKENGEIVTFSRGGSDITGSIITSGVDGELYENWTDVSGFLMADPRIVKNPKPIEIITYKELRELSYMGAPVLHEEAIFPVKKAGIPINIKNTNFPEDPGTMIVNDHTPISSGNITGISGKKDFTVISIEKTLLNSETGILRKLISVFETNDISIEHVPTGIDSISVVVSNSELNSKMNKVIEEIRIYCNPDSISCYPNMALIAVVGRGMIKAKGVSAKVFSALGNSGVNVRMITQGSSELNIIIGIENDDFDKAMTAIYEVFENDSSMESD